MTPYLQAKQKASVLDAELLATDKRLEGSVLIVHRDGSIFFFDSAFSLTFDVEYNEYIHTFIIVLTEHHGAHTYYTEDLIKIRNMGPRINAEHLKE